MPIPDLTTHLQQVENRLASLEKSRDDMAYDVRVNRERIAGILKAAQPPAPNPEDITVGPEDDLQEAIDDAGGKKIWLKDGVYKPFLAQNNTRLQAITPGKVYARGAEEWNGGWVQNGDAWFKPLTQAFYQHPANSVHGGSTPSARGLLHRKGQQPHLLIYDGQVMVPVYDASELTAGTFWLEGTSENPVGIWARFPGFSTPQNGDVLLGTYQYLVKGAHGSVSGVELDGIIFQYCANTGTHGALDMDMRYDSWIVRNCDFAWTMSEGVRASGSNHLFENCGFYHHAHVGFAGEGLYRSQLIGCESSYNGWNDAIDVFWHKGALKWQYGCHENAVLNYRAVGNNGAAYWLDGISNNMDNILDGFVFEDNMAFALMLEHHTQGGVCMNGSIKGTRSAHNGYMDVGSGIQIQGAIEDYLLKNIELDDNAGADVYLKKSGDSRGWSGGIMFEEVKNTGKWVVQGDMNKMPDTYLPSKPDITNWK
jgi:hypothetical protein